ncbi:MAG: ADP-forming succinate--CoA ligase subunit beta [Candidatus Omnitrophica bacterium]|nr:ADP-forming succinate--CoA ligase subunit beta [Candidatus Omnitrophota bacterium]
MKIHEYQARELLRACQVPVSRGELVQKTADAASIFKALANPSCIAKVQVLTGGRGKAGGVKRVQTAEEAEKFVRRFLGADFSTYQSAGQKNMVRSVLIAEDIPIAKEFYLGVVLDRTVNTPVILFSKQGGIEIEEAAVKSPGSIEKIPFSPDDPPSAEKILSRIRRHFSDSDVPAQIAEIARLLARFFVDKDAAVCEINPLALTPQKKVLALDAKMVFDDNALFRRPEIRALKDPEEEDEREKKAGEFGLSYVSMDGNVGCLVNGAGLAMATMDMIQLAGGKPANFLDVGGGATVAQVREGFKIILQHAGVRSILVNIFGGIMKCDVIAQGVLEASREIRLSLPLVVRLEGTRVEEGRALLKNSDLKIISCQTIREAAAAAVQKAGDHQTSHVHPRR